MAKKHMTSRSKPLCAKIKPPKPLCLKSVLFPVLTLPNLAVKAFYVLILSQRLYVPIGHVLIKMSVIF